MAMPRRPYLTARAQDAFARAHDLAAALGHADVTPLHVAVGVLREGRNPGVGALFNLGVPLEAFERELAARLPAAGEPRQAHHVYTASDEALIARAAAEAREMGTEFYGCEHLLLALLRDGAGDTARVLAGHGVGREELRAAVRDLYDGRPAGGPPPAPPA